MSASVLGIPVMLRPFAPILSLVLCCAVLSGCSPPGIPFGASVHWDLKSGFYWTWTRRLEHGCTTWMAKDHWANVQLILDSPCEGERANGYLDGQGLTYFSVSDYLAFRGYWPWTQEEYFNLMVFDDAGMISDIRPCPHALSPEQLDALEVLAHEALREAKTDGEIRVLARVAERLAVTDGAALASGQEGCTDMPPDWHGASIQRQDPWVPR